MRRAARVDANHKEIVDQLRARGYSVQSLATIGRGCPDILVGAKGNNFLFEIKVEDGELTSDQERFAESWQGQTNVIKSISDALAIILL